MRETYFSSSIWELPGVTKQPNEIFDVSRRRSRLQIVRQDKCHCIDFANISKLVTTQVTMKLFSDNLVMEAAKVLELCFAAQSLNTANVRGLGTIFFLSAILV